MTHLLIAFASMLIGLFAGMLISAHFTKLEKYDKLLAELYDRETQKQSEVWSPDVTTEKPMNT
jgi:hypothetical protein